MSEIAGEWRGGIAIGVEISGIELLSNSSYCRIIKFSAHCYGRVASFLCSDYDN